MDAVENAAVVAGQVLAYLGLPLLFCLLEAANDFEYKKAGGMRPGRAVKFLWSAIIAASLFFLAGWFFVKSPEEAGGLFAGLTVLLLGVWENYRLCIRIANPVRQIRPEWSSPLSREPNALELLSILSYIAFFGLFFWPKPQVHRKPGGRKTATARIPPEAIVMDCCCFGWFDFLFMLLFAMAAFLFCIGVSAL